METVSLIRGNLDFRDDYAGEALMSSELTSKEERVGYKSVVVKMEPEHISMMDAIVSGDSGATYDDVIRVALTMYCKDFLLAGQTDADREELVQAAVSNPGGLYG